MRLIDESYTRRPFYGSRRIAAQLSRDCDDPWNRKRIQRLMRIMGIRGVAPGPDISKPHPENKVYPYLLRGMEIANHRVTNHRNHRVRTIAEP